jgi:phosphatidylglycerophosphatase A
MKAKVEKREPKGLLDYVALAFTTCGVGYIPGAPGTYGSAVGVAIYLVVTDAVSPSGMSSPQVHALLSVALIAYCLLGIWAADRSISLLGNSDPSEAVVDEVMGQLITFCFVPFDIGWPFVLAGFLLFRLFDIWKPYPIRDLEVLPGGLGVCADDIAAGVYGGICLAVVYAVYLAI